jgi:Ca-activated chloride channel family protein
MSFSEPLLLALGLVITAALAWAAVAAGRRRKKALRAAGVAAGHSRNGAGLWCTLAGLAVLAFAAAGPSVTLPVSHANGTVILAVDTSGSMGATDVAPNRLTAAKKAAVAFVNAQPASVLIGVVAFQSSGLEAAVPSGDHQTIDAAVNRLAASGGTSLGAAILGALSAITHHQVAIGSDGTLPKIGFWPSATIVLFGDGGDSDSNATAEAAQLAQQAGVHVDTVGVGTATGTTVDVEGYHLFTGLNAAPLKTIAQATNGTYHPASTASELNGIASSINLRLTVTKQPYPLAGAFIALALLLLAAGALLTVLRTGRVI